METFILQILVKVKYHTENNIKKCVAKKYGE